jgi:putative ABC transport system permease protein
MLAPERLSAFVFSVFAGVALLIAVVGVAGVLAFSVSARTHELGVLLAIGSTRRRLLAGVLSEGAWIAAVGIVVGAIGGSAIVGVIASQIEAPPVPGVLPAVAAAAMLIGAAVVASLMPAVRAARVDVLQALRSE